MELGKKGWNLHLNTGSSSLLAMDLGPAGDRRLFLSFGCRAADRGSIDLTSTMTMLLDYWTGVPNVRAMYSIPAVAGLGKVTY